MQRVVARALARAGARAHRDGVKSRASRRGARAPSRTRGAATSDDDGARGGGVKFALTVARDRAVVEPSRLDAYVAANVPDASASRGRVAAAIKARMVTLNGKTASKPSRALKPGDVIEGELERERASEAKPEPWVKLDIVHEDESVLVVNKAAGMVTHPSAGHESGTLVNAVLGHCDLPELVVPTGNQALSDDDEDEEDAVDEDEGTRDGMIRPGIVHRLDKGTSGVMVVAKDASAHNSLCEQFAARVVRRKYVAILSGVPSPSKGRIEAPIGRDPRDRLRMAVTQGGGRFAASNYEVIATLANGNASLVEWRLETGRTHQIRVHAKHIGHPILGDDTYGGGGGAAVSALSRYGVFDVKEAKALMSTIDRPMLHARTLGFTHPQSGEALDFSRDPPEDFETFASRLADKTDA